MLLPTHEKIRQIEAQHNNNLEARKKRNISLKSMVMESEIELFIYYGIITITIKKCLIEKTKASLLDY